MRLGCPVVRSRASSRRRDRRFGPALSASASTRSCSPATATRRCGCSTTRARTRAGCSAPSATSATAWSCTPTPRCCRAAAAPGRPGTTSPSTATKATRPVAVSYLINRLQPLPFRTPVIVTLNPPLEPDPRARAARVRVRPPAARRPRRGRAAGLRRAPGRAQHLLRRRLAGLRLPRGRARLGARRRAAGRQRPACRTLRSAPPRNAMGATCPPARRCTRRPRWSRAASCIGARGRRATRSPTRSFCLRIPLARLDELPAMGIAHNRPGLVSFHDRDHGPRDGSPLLPWIRALLARRGPSPRTARSCSTPSRACWATCSSRSASGSATTRTGAVRAVLAEVNNTFGERHNYLVAHADGRPIRSGETLRARKVFHVSPFCEVRGHYAFRFHCEGDRWLARIDYFDGEQRCGRSAARHVHLRPRATHVPGGGAPAARCATAGSRSASSPASTGRRRSCGSSACRSSPSPRPRRAHDPLDPCPRWNATSRAPPRLAPLAHAQRMPAAMRVLLALLTRLQHGALHVHLPDGTLRRFGSAIGALARRALDPRLARRGRHAERRRRRLRRRLHARATGTRPTSCTCSTVLASNQPALERAFYGRGATSLAAAAAARAARQHPAPGRGATSSRTTTSATTSTGCGSTRR